MGTNENKPKPTCKLIGRDGNVYNLIGTAKECLRHAGQRDQAEAMAVRCFHADDYDHVLAIIGEYVNII
jgi:hypothetical protein